MSELVKRYWEYKKSELADRIEELERANAVLQGKYDQAKTDRDTGMVKHIKEYADIADQLDAEKALADQLYEEGVTSSSWGFPCYVSYRKARGL